MSVDVDIADQPEQKSSTPNDFFSELCLSARKVARDGLCTTGTAMIGLLDVLRTMFHA
jgi:hypothetical protein